MNEITFDLESVHKPSQGFGSLSSYPATFDHLLARDRQIPARCQCTVASDGDLAIPCERK
jgi:hypothetical protein